MKLFIEENGSDRMLEFANAEDDRSKVVSALAQVEVRSAIYRMRRGKLLTPAQAASAVESLSGELRRMIEQPVNAPVLEAANTLVDRHHLRALDAVQLGSAIVARDLFKAQEMRVITSDNELLAAAL